MVTDMTERYYWSWNSLFINLNVNLTNLKNQKLIALRWQYVDIIQLPSQESKAFPDMVFCQVFSALGSWISATIYSCALLKLNFKS